jgi:hypothetical protein
MATHERAPVSAADGATRPSGPGDDAAPASGDAGFAGRHHVDRALSELLEEVRIAQMGAQIMLGFLLAVAYTTVLREASDDARDLYAWAVVVTTAAVVLLLAPVPLHRLNFGRRARERILVVAHVLAVIGLAFLAGAIVLSVWLAARIALPADVAVIVLPVTGLLVLAWLVVPLSLRVAELVGRADE